VVCDMPFDTEEETVSLANGTELGLAEAICTTDVSLEDYSVAFKCFERTQAITVYSGWR
jgi:acyl-CoA reductase-like NAD-dependent aldehyde dehydrogenase